MTHQRSITELMGVKPMTELKDLTGEFDMYKLWFSAIFIALALPVLTSAQSTGIGTVAGTVSDSSNALVPNAAVTLINTDTKEQRHETTTTTGEFVFAAVPPGTYTVQVQAAGFRPLERTNNVLTANSRLMVGNLQLQVGGGTQSVVVTSAPAEVQTESSEKSELVDNKELENVAVRGHDPMSYLGLLPGVVKGVDPDYLGGAYGSSIPSFEGQTTTTNVMMTDGVNGGDSGGGSIYAATVNPEGVSEIHVMMGNYNAEYGIAGGAMINMITKSGGTVYHGSVYYEKRHEEFDANNYFNNLAGLAKPVYRYNIAGASVGGPVKFPKTDMRNKLFFFALYERGEVHNAAAIQKWSMPTAAERAGNFSKSANVNGSPITVTDPLNNNAPFPGNIIPSSREDIYGVAMMNILPLPNAGPGTTFPNASPGGVGYNYIYQEPFFNQPRSSTTGKVDWHPTDADTFSATIKYWSANQQGIPYAASPSPWGWNYGEYAFIATQGTFDYTHSFTPRFVNYVYFGGMHDAEQSPPVGPNCTQNTYNSAGQPTTICGQYNNLLRANNGALAGLGQFNNTWNPNNYVPEATYGNPTSFSSAADTFDGRTPLTGFDYNYSGRDDLTYIYGPHTFKGGIFIQKYQVAQVSASNFSGEAIFNTSSTDPGTTGYAFANAYIGHMSSYMESLGKPSIHSQGLYQALYAQDTWKVTHKLTLDYGLRVYYSDPWSHQDAGVASSFVIEKYNPSWNGNPPALYYPATVSGTRVAVNPLTGVNYPQGYVGDLVPGTGNTCNFTSETNPCALNGVLDQNGNSLGFQGFRKNVGPQWDPRMGFAYDPFGDGKTAIKGSFGVFHEANTGNTAQGDNGGPNFIYTRTVLDATLNNALWQTIPLTSPVAVSGVEPYDAKRPSVLEYLFGFQRDIRKGFVWTSQYVGNTQHYLAENYNYNLTPFGAQFQSQNLDPTSTSGAPLPTQFFQPLTSAYLGVTVSHPAARTRYDSWQNTVHRRFASGLDINGNFTWARTSGYNSWSQLVPVNLFWGPTPNDQKFVANITYVYTLPKASKLLPGELAKLFLDNWQISGVTVFASGFPKNISLSTTNGYNFLGGGDVTAQVSLSCNPELPFGQRTFNQFFNTSCVTTNEVHGNLGSILNGNEFRGPGFNNWDVALTKILKLGERWSLSFRVEAYNVLNHAEASGINTTATINPAGQNTNTALGTINSTLPERHIQFTFRASF